MRCNVLVSIKNTNLFSAQDLTGVPAPDKGGNCPPPGTSVTINGNRSCIAIPKDRAGQLRVILGETQKAASLLGGTLDSLYYGSMTNTTNSTFLTVSRVGEAKSIRCVTVDVRYIFF